jgi:hypothetical protein
MRADGLTWTDVERLWADVRTRSAAGWDPGKALEHMVIRGFALSGLRVEYPFEVSLAGQVVEQVDGLVYLGDVPFLIECKDRQSVDIGVIAKLRTQLQRRPPSTMGCVFSSGSFTEPAVLLANFAVPHRITLWSRTDISEAVAVHDFAGVLKRKYHELCMFGWMDQVRESLNLEEDADDERSHRGGRTAQ